MPGCAVQLLQMLHDEGHPRLLMVRVCGGSRAELTTPGVPEACNEGPSDCPAPPRLGAESLCYLSHWRRGVGWGCPLQPARPVGRLRPLGTQPSRTPGEKTRSGRLKIRSSFHRRGDEPADDGADGLAAGQRG